MLLRSGVGRLPEMRARPGADVSIKDFYHLYVLRSQGAKVKIPKAMDAAFSNPQADVERAIKALIDDHEA